MAIKAAPIESSDSYTTRGGVIVHREANTEDPRGYTAVDLGARSCLYRHPGEGRFYGADYETSLENLAQRHLTRLLEPGSTLDTLLEEAAPAAGGRRYG